MDLGITGRRAILLGSSRGLGRACAESVAREGVLFNNAFCPAPGCSPSRAAFLTGRHIWMIEEAGTHASYFSWCMK